MLAGVEVRRLHIIWISNSRNSRTHKARLQQTSGMQSCSRRERGDSCRGRQTTREQAAHQQCWFFQRWRSAPSCQPSSVPSAGCCPPSAWLVPHFYFPLLHFLHETPQSSPVHWLSRQPAGKKSCDKDSDPLALLSCCLTALPLALSALKMPFGN